MRSDWHGRPTDDPSLQQRESVWDALDAMTTRRLGRQEVEHSETVGLGVEDSDNRRAAGVVAKIPEVK